MKKFFLFGISIFLLVFNLNAKEKKKVEPGPVKDRKVRFDEIEVTGERKNPINAFIISRNKQQLPKLIKLRKDFKDELTTSTDDL